ncbi:hypothetical protein ACP275_01G043300 [Erythranthe tilingii]
MGKNKNRTDLLAAGREKLQQFRQKKDNKGNTSKSSGKAGKPGLDTTATAATEAAVTQQHAEDGESSAVTIPLSESSSRVDSLASDTAAATDELSAKPGVLEIASLSRAAESPLEGSGVDETRLEQSAYDGHDVDIGPPQKDLVHEDAKDNVLGASDPILLKENSADPVISSPIDGSSILDRQRVEEQVTDIGAMQEVSNSCGNQIDGGMVTQPEGDGNLSSNDLSETAGDNEIADSGNTLAEEETHVATQLGKTDNASLIGDGGNDAEVAQQREVILSGSSDEEKKEVLHISGGDGIIHIEDSQASSGLVDAESFSESKTNESEKSLASRPVDLSSVLDGSVIKLSQLAEILRVLDEDEIRFLSISRESSFEKFKDTDEVKVNESTVHDAFERLNEHLYVTSVSKDAFHLQLSEHQTLIDEMCAVNTSLIEAQQKNELSAEEIVQCRYELQEVASDREELQKQLDYSKAEIEDFAAKVNELQSKLEMAQGGMSSLSSELVDCRNLVEALQAENEQLNGSYKLMAEEKKKLSEENGTILLENEKLIGELAQSEASLESLQTLLRDDRVRLEEENDSMLRENSVLLVDLVVYKSTVEALEVENKNLNEILTSLSEERKKIEEEKTLAVHQTEQMSKEFMDCKDLVVTLQTEISDLNGRLTIITEQKIKVEEEKMSIFSEYEKQSHELVEMKGQVAGLQTECSKAVDDLKEATFGNNQITEENVKLVSDLEFHKLQVKEFHQKEHSSQHEEIERDIGTLQKPNFDSSSLQQLKLDVYDDASGFVALKRNLEDAVIVLQKLEKEIDSMHCYSTSLIRPTNKVAPGVSRLIQSFESKSHVDDQDPEQAPSSENQTAEDPYMKTKMVTENLRVRLKALVDDAQNASEFCKVMQSKLLSDAAGTARSQYDSLREHTDQVEEANIELMVLYEAMKEHACHAVAKEGELLIFCDVLQKQEVVLKSEGSQLREKLNDFQATINELQSQLDGTCKDSVEMFASISNQVQTLQAEVADRESILEEEWKSVSDQVLQTIGVLDSTIKTFNLSSSAGEASNLDIVGRVAASVSGADKVIKDLHGQLEAAQRDRQEISDKNGIALNTLHRLYNELSELLSRTLGYYPDETRNVVVDGEVLDLLQPDIFDTLLDQLEKLFGERSQLVSENKQLSSDLMNRARETDKLEKQCLKSDTIMKLVEEIEQSVRLEGIETDANEPASRLESLIHFLVQKYKDADQVLSLSRSLEMQLSDLRGQVEHLNILLVQTENENLVSKKSLKTAEEAIIALNSEVEEKVVALEQSEHRVSSLREKLSIAVTKGKGLISQRESLKLSLAGTSKELERYSQELLSKDDRIHELETKLKVYSEAGERMEALESELSYIRNSATALRESFLLKDSVLQRIEEILEDLELPEHFHSRDIIEKIDWLAKSVGGNSLPLGDWDRRSSIGGGSYSDAGFVGADGLKEDMEPNPSDDLRWKYEELQSKFYGLAEQNEMLEQSLTERNNLVQRWEEILDRLDVPSQLRSMEPEDKIQWLLGALSEAQNHCYSLQQKIDNLEKLCGSLTADVEDSQRRTSEFETAFQQACVEKDVLSKNLEILSRDTDENLKKMEDFITANENLKDEVRMLQEQKLRIEEDIHHTENAVRRLQDLVSDALQDSSTEDVVRGQEGIEHFEEMLRELVENYKTLFSVKPVIIEPTDVHVTETEELSNTSRDSEEQGVVTLSKKLEDSMGELMCLKEERDRYMLNSQSLLREVEELEIKKKELQDLLIQEEHKTASLREKLNVAVRKGKSLVQQRDGMKQVIEELNAEVERLKSETKNTAMEYEERFKNLLTTQERLQVTESENTYLRDRLAETERCLQEKEGSWSSILDVLDEIDVGFEFNSENPSDKLKEIGKYLHDQRTGLDSLEQESRKSKRAAELLLAELNEVQERNDGLQEELTNAVNQISELSMEKELAENAKYEAFKHIEKLSNLHSEEKDRLFSEIMLLKSGVDDTREDLSAIERELGDVLSKDLDVLHNMKDMIKSCLESGDTPGVIAPPSGSLPRGVMSRKSETKVFTTEIGSLRERLYNHSNLLREETSRLSEVVMNVHRENTSQKELYESMKRDVKKFEMIEKEKESELHILQENISLLYEACGSAISEIENWKSRVDGNTLASRAPERNLKVETHTKGRNAFTDTRIFNEEGIRSMSDNLLLVVRDFISMQSEVMDVGQRDMKSTIMNLQKEVHEKDIQRERVCMELVNQIKEAENNAKSYLHDLQQAKVQLRDSQRQLDAMAEERKVLEQEMKELQDQKTNSTDLQQKVNSLTDALASKVQETEALMQALDEEESEMEQLTNKIEGLENELQQKNKDLENIEVSRAKALKKLSITVSKFDELHYFSESLLSEVEKLQSQLQERDGEISFLRQEVTRCTNDALAATQMSKKRSSDELLDLLSWLDSLISRVQLHDLASDDSKNDAVDEYKEVLQKRILGLIHEFENLRVVTQNSDMLLQEERSKVEELAKKEQYLKNSLREKESQLLILQGAGESAKSTSEIVEVEQMTNTWAPPGNVAPQVRSLRKTNNDQVAIAIDVDHSSDRLEDDDDKAHGFKSLTTSKIVPRFTRPVSDMVDGLWVSCDRALMRQPALRLGVIIYWAVLHAMLAIFVV